LAYILLVGGFNPSDKYESQWEELSHVLWKKTCSKPPTSVNRLINQNEFESNYQQLISRGPHLVLRVDMAMARAGKGLELEELPVSVSRDKSAIYK